MTFLRRTDRPLMFVLLAVLAAVVLAGARGSAALLFVDGGTIQYFDGFAPPVGAPSTPEACANLTFDAGLLQSIDQAADELGITRSAFLASAARELGK